jgi:hypothetical protein
MAKIFSDMRKEFDELVAIMNGNELFQKNVMKLTVHYITWKRKLMKLKNAWSVQ